MEISLYIDDAFIADVDSEPIKTAVLTTFETFQADIVSTTHSNVTLMITDNASVQQLNRQYRGIDAPTDVLSFENRPDRDFPDLEPAMEHYLGDIIIAYPVARAQAEATGHTVIEEIILLAIHGALHLLGFDHDTPQNKDKMWAAQYHVMDKLGLAHIQPTES